LQESLWGQLRVKQVRTKKDQPMPSRTPGLADFCIGWGGFAKAVIDSRWLSGGSFPGTSGKPGNHSDESDVLTVFDGARQQSVRAESAVFYQVVIDCPDDKKPDRGL
jgi:hypothetical protein